MQTTVITPHALPIGSSDDPSREVDGVIDGSLVAWIRGDPRGVVVIYDLIRGEVLAESDDAVQSAAPAIEGGRVVFERGGARGETGDW